jgi:hypothetical protein
MTLEEHNQKLADAKRKLITLALRVARNPTDNEKLLDRVFKSSTLIDRMVICYEAEDDTEYNKAYAYIINYA